MVIVMRSRLRGRSLGALIVPLLAMLALPAAAQEAGKAPKTGKLYAGAGLGVARYEGRYEGVSYRDTPIEAELFGGIQLRDRTALELAFTRLPDIRSGEIAGSGVERLDVSTRFSALAVRAVFRLPLSEFLRGPTRVTLFGLVGGYASAEERSAAELVSGRRTDDATHDAGLALGGGVVYAFPRVNIRASVERFAGGEAHPSVMQIGAEFRF